MNVNLDLIFLSLTAHNIANEAVVLVRCGSSWGSGVVLDARSGVVITCSHVVRNVSTQSDSLALSAQTTATGAAKHVLHPDCGWGWLQNPTYKDTICFQEATDKVSIFHKGNCHPADVVFRTRDGLAYDLAVLKTNEASVFAEQMDFADDDAQRGTSMSLMNVKRDMFVDKLAKEMGEE